jgi:hypothetical protein
VITAGFSITLNPSLFFQLLPICQNVRFQQWDQFVFNSNVAGTTYAWSNNNTGIGLASNGTGNISSYTAQIILQLKLLQVQLLLMVLLMVVPAIRFLLPLL